MRPSPISDRAINPLRILCSVTAPMPPRTGLASAALEAWDRAEPHVLRLFLKVVLKASVVIATPFLALALLFLYLGKPWLWLLVPGALGGLVLVLGLVAFLVLRAKLRRLRAKVEAARDLEGWVGSATGR